MQRDHCVYGMVQVAHLLYILFCADMRISAICKVGKTWMKSSRLTGWTPSLKENRHKLWNLLSVNIRTVLLLVVLLGTCMLIGDGVLTPTISGENFFFVSVRNTKFSFLVFVLNVSTCFCFRVQCCLQCQAYKLQLTSSVSVSSSNTILASFFSLIKSLDKEFLLQIKYFQWSSSKYNICYVRR